MHRAVAAAIYIDPNRVLVVRRREDARDFPSMLALPSTMVKGGEDPVQTLKRLGKDRLGITLFADEAPLAVGDFDRAYGVLRMTLWRCKRVGVPQLMEDCNAPIYSGVMWMRIDDLARVALPNTCCALLCGVHGLRVHGSS
jgi:8-oxo-dGTP pyrophosphatase MutT (NUDIX family)